MAERSESSDRRAIHDVVLSYCRGIDRLDLDLVRAAYHPGALDHHTGFDGPIEDYVAWVSRGLRQLGGTMHMIANHVVELRGNRAVAETYGQAVHWPPAGDDGGFTTGFRYIDDFEFRDGRWAIAERWAVREWAHRNTVASMPAAAGPVGSRDAADPLYLALGRLDEPR